MKSEIEVRPITAVQAIPLRHEVLRPGRPVETAMFAGDEEPITKHFGAFKAGEIVGVASLFLSRLPEKLHKGDEGREEWQLRGMAVDPTLQKQGVGQAVLGACIDLALKHENILLWCNARLIAVDFYKRAGFETRGDEFIIPDVGPHYVMVYAPSK